MNAVMLFSVTLLAGVLLSGIARRSLLSLVVLFLAAGFLGSLVGAVNVQPNDQKVTQVAEFALVAVLFTDSQKLALHDLRMSARLASRALLIGLPISFAFTSIGSHYIVGLDWASSLLLAATLAPTDPVFASALLGREEVPRRLRRLLNVESGLNDGLALPVVVIMLAVVNSQDVNAALVLGQAGHVVLGATMGAAIAAFAALLERHQSLSPSDKLEPLYALAVVLVIWAVTRASGANEFLGTFAGGVTLVTIAPHLSRAFDRFGELLSELLKLAGVFIFGALISWTFVSEIDWTGWVFAAFVLLAVRPAGMFLATIRSGLTVREFFAASWFGPKGFASAIYALLVLNSGATSASLIFHLAAIIIAVSMIVHSTTDVVVARWFVSESSDVVRLPERRHA